MREALVVMAERPEPGKMCLAPHLSYEQAAVLYTSFLLDMLDIVRSVAEVRPSVTPYIAYAPQEESTYFLKLARDFKLVPQRGDSQSERLDHVLADTLQSGYGQIVVTNSNSPTLPVDYVAQAFTLLDDDRTDVVLGPCEDDGYYLIGARQIQPRLARQIQLSAPHVLQDMLALAEAEGVNVALLPLWYDVDTAAEFAQLRMELALAPLGVAQHTRKFIEILRSSD